MHETTHDLTQLQELLDRSDAEASAYHRSIFRNRIRADELPALLPGVQIITLATVTSRCEPRAAAVDGIFYRGRFYFGSSPGALRFHHIRHRPHVSATHIRGEQLAVVIHGTAVLVDTDADEHARFRAHLLDVYGPKWEAFGPGAPYARIEPVKVFAARDFA